jgi:hypothetical protein
VNSQLLEVQKQTGGVAQTEEHLPSDSKALNSKPSPAKKRKKKKPKEEVQSHWLSRLAKGHLVSEQKY